MSELGQVLQRAREEKGISLDDIQKATKIQRRYLEAIERGHFHVLPGHFYARAFIKSYAEAVGLDPTHILSQYQEDLPAQPPLEQLERLRRRRVDVAKEPLQAGRWVAKTLLVLFVVLVVGMIYTALVNRNNVDTAPIPGSTVNQPEVRQPDANPPSATPGSVATPGTPAAQTPSAPAVGGTPGTAPGTPAAGVTPGAAVNTPAVSPNTPATGGTPGTPPGTAPGTPGEEQSSALTFVSQQGSVFRYTVAQADRLSIKVTAVSGDCWVEVREARKGKSFGQGMIHKGEERVFEAGKTAYVIVGNPKPVTITVNNQPINTADLTFMPSILDIKVQP